MKFNVCRGSLSNEKLDSYKFSAANRFLLNASKKIIIIHPHIS